MHIWLISFLLFSMLIGRRTLSYFQLGPFYWIELISLIVLFVVIMRIFILQFNVRFSGMRNVGSIAVFLYLILSAVLLAIYGFNEGKELILVFYVSYYFLFLFIFNNSNYKSLHNFKRFWVFVFPLIPLIIPPGKILIIALFGEIAMPGGTFVYPVTFMISLLLVKNIFLRYFLSSVSMIFIFLSFERGSFVNLFIIIFVLSLVFIFNDERKKLREFYQGLVLMFIGGLFALSVVFPLFDFSDFRYSLDLSSFIEFIQSIFVSESAYGGTRNHRIEMWMGVLDKSFNNGVLSILFGNGFEGTVSDTDFRAIHNEYISIYYRTGLIGLILYVFFLMSVMLQFIRLMKYDQKVSIILLIVLVGFLSDALTGTIITSPFLSVVVYAMLAYGTAWSYALDRHRHARSKINTLYTKSQI
jgi:O-antigen ligase